MKKLISLMLVLTISLMFANFILADNQEINQSPGLELGRTYYDCQSEGRMQHQIDWRNTQDVHFTWVTDTIGNAHTGTSYQIWDAESGDFEDHYFYSEWGGCWVHPLLTTNISGHTGLDVFAGLALISNHHDDAGTGYAPSIWRDFTPGACFFSPFRMRVPDTLMDYSCSPEEIENNEFHYGWPSTESQTYAGDTIIHIFAQQYKPLDDSTTSYICYYRLTYGFGDSMPTFRNLLGWDYPPMVVDTNIPLSHIVTSSHSTGKAALVWTANLPEVPGNGESLNHQSRVDNDVYYMISDNMGGTWSDKINLTKSDSSLDGWRVGSEISALITSDENLHIIWSAREYSAEEPHFPHYYGSNLFHWDEVSDSITVIKDANWDLPEEYPCYGGRWDDMSIVKPSISECDGKLYALFVMFNDIYHGKIDDCHASNGLANGELYLSLSTDNGLTWSLPVNLTNTYRPGCTDDCGSEMWPSMSRYGMEVTDGIFSGVPVVDPSGGYTGNYYLDVQYIEDKIPGSAMYDSTGWTINPVKWFRVACVDNVSDTDDDEIVDYSDNCPDIYNPTQEDSDGDGAGDVCDPMCGDANGNFIVNILDITYMIGYLYMGGPPPVPYLCGGDADGNGMLNILDITYLIVYLYKGGPAPIENCCAPIWK